MAALVGNFAGCSPEDSQSSRTLDNQFSKAGGFVMNCDHGGTHCGAPSELQTAGWKFMQDHPFGVSPEPYAGGIPSGYPRYCQKFAN
ncbi:MAG TPA: hypothetical protein VJV78_30145 [Polyangiales bacterium]|nr:hypothetical protein [Polyangiales bacterium]